MAKEYAGDKPKGFKNHIENVAIVGVWLTDAADLQVNPVLSLTFSIDGRQRRKIPR